MYNLLYSIYFKCSKLWMSKNSFLTTLIFKSVSAFTQIYLNLIYKNLLRYNSRKLINNKKHSPEIIVSLTTFPQRIETVWITIETIFNQTFQPDRIILWLAYEQFPNRLKGLPKKLLDQQKRGLEIKFCEDYKSHKKYYFSMKENPESIIITIDDDVFYPKDTIQNLMTLHYKYPTSVICNSAEEISDDFYTIPSLWHSPHFNHINNLYGKCRILGISGILYPPHSLHELTFDVELRKKLCPWADDLWLTIMALINGSNVIRYEFRSNPLDIKGTQSMNLSRGKDMGYDVTQGLSNDEQWINLTSYFKKQLEVIFKQKRTCN